MSAFIGGEVRKICKTCKRNRPIEQYRTVNNGKYSLKECKSCHGVKDRARMAKRYERIKKDGNSN